MNLIRKHQLLLAFAAAALTIPALSPKLSAQCVAGLGGGTQPPLTVAGDYTSILLPTGGTETFVQPKVLRNGFIVDAGLNAAFEITGYTPASGLMQGGQVALPTGGLPTDVVNAGVWHWFLTSKNRLILIEISITTGSNPIYLTVNLPGAPTGMLFDGTYVWVVAGQTMLQFAVPAGTAPTVPLVGQYQLPFMPTGELVFDGSAIWIPAGHAIYPFDPSQHQIGPKFTFGGTVTQMAFDGVYLWVSQGGNAEVTQFDPLTGLMARNFSTPAYASGIVFDGVNLYAADQTASMLFRVRPCDVGRDTVLPELALVRLPAAATALLYDGARKYITYSTIGTVSVR